MSKLFPLCRWNTTSVGPYLHPKVRLPGSGGGTELSSLGPDLLLVSASTNRRSYPDRVDYITSPGFLGGGAERERLGYKPGTGPQTLVNPLGLFRFNDSGEMYAAALHPGVGAEQVRASFGWPITIAGDCVTLPEPTAEQVTVTREEIANARSRSYLMPE